MTHTPGPWHVDGVYGEGQLRQQIMGADRAIASIWQHFNRNNKALEIETDQANACLIAAAPDLLAACKFSLSVHRAQGLFDLSEQMAAEKLEAAIAKAEASNIP